MRRIMVIGINHEYIVAQLEICQSGSWSKQPLPTTYTDTFDGSGLSIGVSLCTTGTTWQRTYTLNLANDSLVLMSFLNSNPGYGWSFAGIGQNSNACGYNANQGNPGSTASSTCTLSLSAGMHQFQFCSATNLSNGTITVIPQR